MTGVLGRYLADALAHSKAPIAGGGGVATSLEALLARAQAIMRGLSAIEPGEPILATISNTPMDLAAMLGIWLAGGVVVPLEASAAAITAERLQQATGARFRVEPAGVASLATGQPPPRELLREAALVIFTSGSTGQPKGVVIAHDRMAGKLGVLDRLIGLSAADQVVVPHVKARTSCPLQPLRRGSRGAGVERHGDSAREPDAEHRRQIHGCVRYGCEYGLARLDR